MYFTYHYPIMATYLFKCVKIQGWRVTSVPNPRVGELLWFTVDWWEVYRKVRVTGNSIISRRKYNLFYIIVPVSSDTGPRCVEMCSRVDLYSSPLMAKRGLRRKF